VNTRTRIAEERLPHSHRSSISLISAESVAARGLMHTTYAFPSFERSDGRSVMNSQCHYAGRFTGSYMGRAMNCLVEGNQIEPLQHAYALWSSSRRTGGPAENAPSKEA
jgi:hypothetical protein